MPLTSAPVNARQILPLGGYPALAGSRVHAVAVAALLTLDRSGYLREVGVRWLTGGDELFVLPFLLLRLNDPAEPVRDRADATQLHAFLDHPDARVRGETWRALRTLHPHAFHSRVDQLRADPSSKVRRHLP
jgi:hypothetical protein